MSEKIISGEGFLLELIANRRQNIPRIAENRAKIFFIALKIKK
jgi:hypothetical protein